MKFGAGLGVAIVCGLMVCYSSRAQVSETSTGRDFASDGSNSPFGRVLIDEDEAEKVNLPALDFIADAKAAANFDKYFYFRRPDTDFATAFADVSECDGYARGISWPNGSTYPMTTAGGVLGSALGEAANIAIFGSAMARLIRRVNMRTCMHFKGYERYGLSKQRWEAFNFEEGLSTIDEKTRRNYLKVQARVASSSMPSSRPLGL